MTSIYGSGYVADMMTTREEALRLADALEEHGAHQVGDAFRTCREAAALLRQWPDAGEPVAWCELTPNGSIAYFDGKPMVMCGPVGNECHTVPLYAAPPAAQPAAPAVEPLTERIAVLEMALRKVSMNAVFTGNGECSLSFAIVKEVDAALAAIERAHGITQGEQHG